MEVYKILINTNTKMQSFNVIIRFSEQKVSCTFSDKEKLKRVKLKSKELSQLQEVNLAG